MPGNIADSTVLVSLIDDGLGPTAFGPRPTAKPILNQYVRCVLLGSTDD